MAEKDVIAQTRCPNTLASLTKDLHEIGVNPGDTLLVHVSMKSLGWVSGGPQAVIQALMDALTSEGTLVIQTHSPTLSDPAEWQNPPVPEHWHDTIRQTMPAYDPEKTPSTYLGVVPELFRKFPNVHRSHHPAFSISAWGKNASMITSEHPLDYSLSDHSPLGKTYQLDAKVLLLGTGYDANTSFHLSEYRSGTRKLKENGAPLQVEGAAKWTVYKDIEFDDDSFEEIGEQFEKERMVVTGKIGQAHSRLFSMPEAVDYAAEWFKKKDH